MNQNLKNKKLLILSVILAVVIAVVSVFSIVTYNSPETVLQRKMHEDYEYFWDFMDENYALWGVLERAGFDRVENKEKYSYAIAACDNYDDFYKYVMNPLSVEFAKIAKHTTILNNDAYQLFYSMYSTTKIDFSNEIQELFTDEQWEIMNNQQKYLLKVLSSSSFYKKPNLKKDEENTVASEDTHGNVEGLILEDNVGYVKISSMLFGDNEMKYLEDQLVAMSKLSNIIIDIRGNGGGSDAYWLPILFYLNGETLEYSNQKVYNASEYNQKYYDISKKELKPIQKEKLGENFLIQDLKYVDKMNTDTNTIEPNVDLYTGFDGDVWLLVDNRVFSSGDSCAYTMKATGFATLVGESTGGDRAGDALNLFSLPNSGLIFRYSSGFTLNDDGSNNAEFGTAPDVTINDGEDALEVCKGLIDQRKANILRG